MGALLISVNQFTGAAITRGSIMPKPRYTQVSLEATPHYHCYSRWGLRL